MSRAFKTDTIPSVYASTGKDPHGLPLEAAPATTLPRTRPGSERTSFGKVTRVLLIVIGTTSLAVGIVGIFVPILPTTPFLLLSAACYIRSSQRFYHWLISNRLFGDYIRNYIERKGVPLRVKVLTLVLLWITIGCSAALATDTLWVRIVLIAVAIGVTTHIFSLRTLAR